MRKSLLTGIAVCAAASAFAGHAHALVKHPAHKHPARVAEYQAPIAEYGRRGYPTQFRIPAHPLVWDCVHVMFPQCTRGYDGLNDGSFR
jgi:hypothetical protein